MPKKLKKDEMITFPQAAELYGFSTSYLRDLAIGGRLKAKKFGVQWVTTPADMEAYIESRKVRGVYKKDIKKKI